MGSGCCKQSNSNPNTDVDDVTQSNPAATTTPESTTAVRATQPDLELGPLTDNYEGVKVTDPTSEPYKWICTLEVIKTTQAGTVTMLGTGFKIHFPGINQCMIMTAAHLIYVDPEDSIDKVTITFPGQAPFTVNSKSAAIFPSSNYIREPKLRWSYNYGMIALPNMNSDEGFGWSCVVPDDVLKGCDVTVCGYSKKHDWPQMWKLGQKIKTLTYDQLDYENPWLALQGDGVPVYMMYKGNWTVVGNDSKYNSADVLSGVYRFNNEMIRDLIEKSQNLKKYALQSVQWPDLYIHCDGKDVNEASSNYAKEGGNINCQYKPPSDSETFYIFPVEVTPSSAQEQKYIVILQSVKWPSIYVRMDASGMTQPIGPGGGVVNCQWLDYYRRATSWEAFDCKKDTMGQSYFQSVQFPNCYIRFKGTGVTSRTDNGGGVVNCQYYYTENDVTSWEKFHLEPQ